MKTGRPKRTECVVCGTHVSVCGKLSARGKCDSCGTGKSISQQNQLAAHTGPEFKRWRAKSILAAGGILPDDLKEYAE